MSGGGGLRPHGHTAAGDGGTISTTPADGSITDAKLRDSAALSVIGRSANSTGDPADIAAGADGDILRRSGTTLGFGTVAAASVDVADTGTHYSGSDLETVLDEVGDAIDSLVGGGAGVTVEDEGTPLATVATTLNFTGAGVTATGGGTTKTIDIPGGGAAGWASAAWPLTHAHSNAYTQALNMVAQWTAAAIPILVPAPMLLQSCSFRNLDTSLARSWAWHLYVDVNSSGTLDEVAGADGSESFTAGAASTRTADASGAPVTLAAGLYWLVVQNTHASNAFTGGSTTSGSSFAPNNIQTTTALVGAVGSTLDFVTSWSKSSTTVGVRLNGRVFAQSTAF